MKGIFTLSEAAQQLGIKPDTLRQQIAAGRLSAEKVGSFYVVTQTEINRYAAQQKGKPGPKA